MQIIRIKKDGTVRYRMGREVPYDTSIPRGHPKVD